MVRQTIVHAVNIYEEIESRARSVQSLEEAGEVLERVLSGGFAVWRDGKLYSIKQLIAQVKGLRIEIYPREHPPPHFHVRGGGIDATFSILNGSILEGHVGDRERKLVEWWYECCRPVLVNAWNKSRPSDCPVGPILEASDAS